MTSTQTRERPPAPRAGAAITPKPEPPAPPARKVGLRSLFPYLQGHWPTLGIVAVLSLVVTLLTLSQPVLTRDVLADIEADKPVGRLVALLIGVLIVVAVLSGVRDFMLQRAAEGLVLTARRRLVARLLRLPITEYDQRRTGDLLSRVGADTTLLRAVVTSGLFDTVTNVVMVGGSAVMMCLIDPTLFAATALGLGLGVVAVVGLSRRVRGASRDAQDRIGEMTSAVERAISAVRTIRASGAEEREARAVDGYAKDAYNAGMRIAKLQAMINPITSTTIQVAFLVVLGLGGARVASGAIQVGDMVAFVLFLFMLWFPLGRALTAYSRLQSGLGALQRIEEMVDLPQETDTSGAADAADAPGIPRTPPGGALSVRERTRPEADTGAGRPPAIEFDRVSFGYAGGERVLRDVSLTVPRGTRTALVGPSGAGKSTLLSLVERFYDVTSGAVKVGGIDVRELPRRQLRHSLGYVEQSAPVLAGTVRDNLSLASPDATDDDMREVLRSVNLEDVIMRAPLGLDTQVGEGGVLLSGGERQRLALARTFLAAPPIMLLDEATSNLDARNEALMRNAISTVTADRTLLVVAHRLSTVVDSDQIVVLEHGEVVAAGRHDELTGSSPLYRELASHQLLIE
ncbi:ABC transporter ATP-binding protein [Streptomyces sp. DT2A-34]|uniref:ABC transporter ATP-binding protein n=1 Tax=Streptomyces sp. DT2A-34 TaxID=3051182 RepID=UPI00265C6D82|nr:ABC transporter ATP-binding protein [Streptomyces sp. DT2A-34]MDO0915395.1 ABC transporter ATP-binding protein [Streptomyces sp. DT2A-34]